MINWRVGVVLLIAIPVAGWAQAGGKAADRVLAPMIACRTIGDVGARAACFDAALNQFRQAISAGQVVIVDRQQAAEDRRSLFGLGAAGREPSQPSVRKTRAARAPADPMIDAIDATILSSRSLGYDKWAITLSTGAVWRTLEPELILAPPVGADVHIQRGAMGGFTLRIGKGRAILAARVR